MARRSGLEAKINALVTQDLLKRGYRVQARARRHLGGDGGHPRRINTGALRASIQVTPSQFRGNPAVRIGTNRFYARYVHEGTGLYGPLHHLIRPRSAKALAFPGKAYGKSGKIVVRYVRGMKPNAFLRDALAAARD